jgi:hypothetical protein
MASIKVSPRERRQYPTYKTAQRVLNGDMTAPVEFFGWTVLRSLILVPGLALGGVRGWNLVTGALAGSTMVSFFALYRTYATKKMEERERRFVESPISGHRRRRLAAPSRRRPRKARSRMRRAS